MQSSLVGGIYDKMIVNMTRVWYKHVLEKQNDNVIILDVGIGTASKLLFILIAIRYYTTITIFHVTTYGCSCHVPFLL